MSVILVYRKGSHAHNTFCAVPCENSWSNPFDRILDLPVGSGFASEVETYAGVNVLSKRIKISKEYLMKLADRLYRHLIKRNAGAYVSEFESAFLPERALWSGVNNFVDGVHSIVWPEEDCEIYVFLR